MKKSHGFTLVELLVVIGIIVVLIALLLPAIGVVRARGRSAQCQSNLAEIGVALAKANGTMPNPLRAAEWPARLPAFLDGETDLLICPSESEGGTSYGMNDRVHRMLGGDSGKIAMLDYRTEQAEIVRSSVADQNWASYHDPRHRGQLNVLVYSGAVAAHDPEMIDPTYCKPFLEYWRPQRDFGTALADCTVGLPPTDGSGGTTGGTTNNSDGGTDGGSSDGGTDGTIDEPLPTGCAPSASNGYVDGLCGEYYKSTKAELEVCWLGDCPVDGNPDATQIDTDLDFPNGGAHGNYGVNLPATITDGNSQQAFAVVWKGEIRAPHGSGSEDYTFYVAYDNGPMITIGGTVAIDERGIVITSHPCCVYHASTPVSMTGGEWVDIEVFLANHWGPHHFSVEWESASTPRGPLPASALRTAAP